MIATILKQLWNRDWILRCLVVVCIPLLAWTIYLNYYPCGPIQERQIIYVLFVLLFSCFDAYGFSLTQNRDDEYSELRISYRIIQDMYEVALLHTCFLFCGWPIVISCLIAHWFTACDKLFYVLRREPDYPGEYTWLEGWSVFLVLKYIGIKPRTTFTFNMWAATGFVAGALINILW